MSAKMPNQTPRKSRMTPQSTEEWGAAFSRWFGMVGLTASFVVWVLTQRVEPIFVTTFSLLLMAGQGAQAFIELRKPIDPPLLRDIDPEGEET